jgi:hypothetical protein
MSSYMRRRNRLPQSVATMFACHSRSVMALTRQPPCYALRVQSAPAWLSYASPAVALVALLVSVATYYRAGPRVEVDATSPWHWKPSDGDLQVTVVVRNTGLAPIQIVSVRIAARLVTPHLTMAFYVPFSNDDAYEGPDFPLKLEPGHQQTWVFDAVSSIKRQYGADYKTAIKKIVVEQWPMPRDLLRSFFSRPHLRDFNPLRMLTRSWGLDNGLATVVELGNGVQVASRMWRLSWLLVRHYRNF